jgi:hypothetical protein
MYKKYTEPRKLERKIVYDIHNFLGPCECVRPQNIRKMCIYRSVLMEEGGGGTWFVACLCRIVEIRKVKICFVFLFYFLRRWRK